MNTLLRKIILIILFSPLAGCSYFDGFNPLPSMDQIQNANITDQTSGLSAAVPNDKINQMRGLFNESTKTIFPSKWQVYGFIKISCRNGELATVYIYSTSDSIGAFNLNDQYFRGGSGNSFKTFFTEIFAANQRLDLKAGN